MPDAPLPAPPKPMPMPRPLRRAVLGSTLCLLLFLAACGKPAATLPNTQVAAQVGSEEISLHQVNAALAQSAHRDASAAQLELLSRSTLESLIDQQVAVAQAETQQLQRDPEVMAQIEAARRSVLANAYLKQYASSLPKPPAEDARAYYDAHPALFSERRVYTVQEIVVARTPELLAQFERMAGAHQSMDEVAAWLNARQIAFRPLRANRAAEQIPLDLLPRMHALQDGQVLVFTAPGALTMLRLLASRTEPVSEALALPRIDQYLGTQRTVAALTAHMQDLRSKTQVVYRGAFATPVPGTDPSPVANPLASPLPIAVSAVLPAAALTPLSSPLHTP